MFQRAIFFRTILWVCLLAFCTVVSAAEIKVCSDCDHQQIKTAVAQAKSYDTVYVLPGLYAEADIIIDKPLTLIGQGFPRIDASSGKSGLIIRADSVSISGVHIVNVQVSHLDDRAGIRVEDCKEFRLTNNHLTNTFFGIYLQHAKRGIISGNIIKANAKEEMNSGNAIHLWYCNNVEIVANEVSGHRDGIYLEFVKESLIRENLSTNNIRYGLHFMFSDHNEYLDNIFRNNGAGVAVMFSKFINMRNNLFEENWGATSYGLLLKEIYDAEIINNRFIKNCTGIYVEGCTRINYKRNNFEGNGWAIRISGGCVSNEISGNNFIGNSFDLSTNSSSSENSFDGNFWSAYDGYDLDHDGVGDVPYRPVKLFNYIVDQTPEAVVLLRSFFIDLLNFSEKVNPLYTPKGVMDNFPRTVKFNSHD
ncbi:MAG: nitrous oxide reductase family maturation protein NosD [Saprospiraceae bacterium]|nr:nitrous oxide reductase family maturation protein NosD [Saprospiraceae bacterium]